MFKTIESYEAKKQLFCKQIIRLLRMHGALSKGELQRLTHMKLSTLVRWINVLMDDSIISPTEPGASSGGRKPLRYRINEQSGYIIAVDIARIYTRIALLNLDLEVIRSEAFGMVDDSTPQNVAEKILSMIRSFGEMIDSKKILGICAGVVGMVDTDAGIILQTENYPSTGWTNVPISQFLEEKTALPVMLRNSIDAAALGEFMCIDKQDISSMAYVNIGAGLQMSMIVNGELVQTRKGSPAYFGHLTVSENGPACFCGKNGCLETYTSVPAILDSFRLQLKAGRRSSVIESADTDLSSVQFSVFCEAANSGDPLAVEVLDQAARALSVGLINTAYILNPQEIILGGPLIRKCNPFFELAKKHTQEKLAPGFHYECTISRGIHEENAVFIGLGNMLMNKYLD